MLCAAVIQSCLSLLGNSLLFSGHPLNSPTSQYSPGSHLCGPFSFPGRKARDDDGSSPLTSYSPGITHTPWQPTAPNLAFVCHLHPSLGPLLGPPPHPLPPTPNPGLQTTKAHTRLERNSLWPVHSASLGGASRFWTSASHLCNVVVRGRGLRDRFS